MFETLDDIRREKLVSSLFTRTFFLTWGVFGALGAFMDFYRHRPVLLCIELLIAVLSLVWLLDSWEGSSEKKLRNRFICVVSLFLLSEFTHSVWYS